MLIHKPEGRLAREVLGVRLPLEVLRSNAGYYIGTTDEDGPVSRESLMYYGTYKEANEDLNSNSFLQNWEV